MIKQKSIPQNWTITTVGDVYDVIGGGTPSTSVSDYWEGKIPWITSADIYGVRDIEVSRYVSEQGIKNSATNKVPPKTLLVVTRVGLGKIAIAECEMCFSQDLQGLVQSPDVIWPEYALYYLSYELQKLKFEGRGTTISGITKKQLKDAQFPLPPHNEQKRIVARIEELFSELDNGIENLKTAREQLKVYRQAVLKYAFEGKLTANWREQNKDKLESAEQLLERVKQNAKNNAVFNARETSDLPKIPSRWLYTRLANVGELGRGKSKHRPRNDKKLFGGNYPFIQTGEVKAANRLIKECTQTYSDFGLAQSKVWPAGKLCITIAANIAETAFLGIDACFPDSFVGFTAQENIILPEYVDFFIQSVRTRIEAYAPATAQKNINLTTLESLIIPLCSLDEQREMVRQIDIIFSSIDSNNAEMENSLQKAEALRQSILKKAFSGRLVAQDPNAEPASVLLERIHAEKDAQKTEGKKPKAKRNAA